MLMTLYKENVVELIWTKNVHPHYVETTFSTSASSAQQLTIGSQVQNRSQQINDKALIRCEYTMANFSTGDRMRKPKGDRRSTEISLVILQTMEACILTHLMPQSQIDLFVQVLQGICKKKQVNWWVFGILVLNCS